MGPRLLKWGKKETTYSLRLFPLGGFCSMEGEDEGAPTPSALGGHADSDEALLPTDENDKNDGEPQEELLPPDTSRSFAHKKVWQRILIVIAGAFMNLLLGFILILCYNLFCTSGDYVLAHLSCTTTIANVGENFDTPLQAGDTIVKMDGERLYSHMDFITFLQTDEDGKFDVLVERPQADGTMKDVLLEDVDFYLTTNEETGLRYLNYKMDFFIHDITAGTVIQTTAKQEFSVLVYTWRSLKYMLQGKYGLNDLSGPVGTIDIIGDAVQNAVEEEDRSIGIGFLLFLVALLTINIGVVNLLPLPALDGGRLVFLIWEGITRRPVPAKYEGIVHLIGMILLLILSVFIAFNDVLKIFG
jgi:regulator of sigma E protease